MIIRSMLAGLAAGAAAAAALGAKTEFARAGATTGDAIVTWVLAELLARLISPASVTAILTVSNLERLAV
ncbi:hypothetical protein KDK_24180 [Dictyobacter kobayashii]|uniref:DUF4126 domain-containing protein n=1 Tax=Dictyobacter kobayashii TaxID=2014872 RepID=A0A402AHM5_9CHLR|nr:hypothetical protein KDK_24180 [Dictyobacter kobayashii]